MRRKTLFKNRLQMMKKDTEGMINGKFSLICHNLLTRYSYYFLFGMVLCMLASTVLAFTVMRTKESKELPAFPGFAADGLFKTTTDIIGSYNAIIELETLQRSIAFIIQKDTLSTLDSIQLSYALKRYEQIERELMHPKDTTVSP